MQIYSIGAFHQKEIDPKKKGNFLAYTSLLFQDFFNKVITI